MPLACLRCICLHSDRTPSGGERRIIVNESCSIQHYWDVEDRTEYRNEFIEGQIISRIGTSVRHGDLMGNLAVGLRNREADSNWRVLMGLRTKVERTGAYVWPDVTVYEEPGRFESRRRGDDESLLDSILMIEVFSALTEALDRGTRWRHYQTIPSLREYLLVAQDRVSVERYVRRDDVWLYSSTTDLNAVVNLASLGCAIPMREIYDRVELPRERTAMLIPPVDLQR